MSPVAHDPSPASAAAAAVVRSSPSTAAAMARSAWAMAAGRVAADQGQPGPPGRDARPGTRASSGRSTTTRADGGPASSCSSALQPRRDRLEVVAGHQRADEPGGQDRTVGGRRRRAARRPSARIRCSRRSRRSVGDGQLDQLGGRVDVPAGQRVPHGVLGLAGGGVPAARAPVQLRCVVGPLGQQVRAQDVARRGGGSGTSVAGRRAGRRRGCAARASRASAREPVGRR